ncbi:MAG: hypothetical protein HYY67_03385 [Thaumarchaeota archaeon]|nr:hypothetical protein [Nitrososphaerota archaeon]
MKPEFLDYLKTIGMPEKAFDRIEKIFGQFQELTDDHIEDIFVSEYIDEDGAREFENLLFFSKKYLFGAPQFLVGDRIEVTTWEARPYKLQILKTNYDMKNATTDSRVNVRIFRRHGGTGRIKASRENCDYLVNLIKKYYVPNIG